jgi:hypothetical protein
MIHADEEIIAGNNQHFRVVDVVPFDEEDESPFVGMLKVEAAFGVSRAKPGLGRMIRLGQVGPCFRSRYPNDG